jgi:hypothetical protein
MPRGYNHLDFLMRPAGFQHMIFGGYTALSSIFFFLKNLGYYYFTPVEFFKIDEEMILKIVEGQRFYLLFHIFFIIGLMIKMNYEQQYQYKVTVNDKTRLLIIMTFVFTFVFGLLKLNQSTIQIGVIFLNFSLVTSIIATALSLKCNSLPNKIITISFFSFNYYSSITSGWKEAIIIPIVLLIAYLYPFYKTTIKLVSPLIIAMLFFIVPSYNNIIRSNTFVWGDGKAKLTPDKARELAINQIKSGEVDFVKEAWGFISGRITELDMFVVYMNHFPEYHDFYGFELISQGFEALMPRAFNPNKPSTETIVMKRVWEAGVVSDLAIVSAKPAPVADAYMSGGWLGIVITGFILGFLFSQLSMLCERLFGGYFWGSCVVFTGLFLGQFRGECFEFMIVDVFYRFVCIYALVQIGLFLKILQRV